MKLACLLTWLDLATSQMRGLGMRLACLLTWLDLAGPTAHGVRGVSTWCSRNVHVVLIVADQEHSDCVIPRYRYTNCASANCWIVPIQWTQRTQKCVLKEIVGAPKSGPVGTGPTGPVATGLSQGSVSRSLCLFVGGGHIVLRA